MSVLPAENVIRQFRWRYAVKKFDPTKRISRETWNAIEEALILSPSSYGLQPWRFAVITSPEVKATLPAISWTQTQPRDCSHMVIIAARKGIAPEDVEHYLQSIMKTRGTPPEMLHDFKNMMLGTLTKTPANELDVWTSRQCYIALGFLMSAAAMLGVDACPMEGLVLPEYDALLGLPKLGYSATVGCALGYRASDDWLAGLPKVRYPASEVVIRV